MFPRRMLLHLVVWSIFDNIYTVTFIAAAKSGLEELKAVDDAEDVE